MASTSPSQRAVSRAVVVYLTVGLLLTLLWFFMMMMFTKWSLDLLSKVHPISVQAVEVVFAYAVVFVVDVVLLLVLLVILELLIDATIGNF